MTVGDSSVIAVDVGGTSIKSALVTHDGRIEHAAAVPTPADQGPHAVVDAIRHAVRSLAGPDTLAVGLVVPGAVDSEAGIASYSANLGWRDVPLRDLVEAETGLPAVVEHDIRGGGLAESLIGRARGTCDSLVVIIGTGIAARVVSGGHVVRGATGVPGEIGHMPVWPDGEACPCGQRGCLERYASAAAIARRYGERSGRSLSSEEVAALLHEDPDADAVWSDAVEALGLALASTTMLLDPSLVVLAGGLSHAGDALLTPTREAVARRVIWRSTPRIELSALGSRAGLLGAAVLAWQRVGTDDFTGWVAAR